MDLTEDENSDNENSSENKESEVEELIAELCMNTSSNQVKFSLRKYQYGKTIAQIEKDINKDRVETLRETANFLKIPNCENKTKKSLSHLITCKIQNLLPDNCSICNRRYSISLHESPILECAVCGQGIHKPCWLNLASIANNEDIGDVTNPEMFEKVYNPLNLPGLFYICEYCKPNTIPSDEEGNYKRKKSATAISQSTAAPNQRNDTKLQEAAIENQTPNLELDQNITHQDDKRREENEEKHDDDSGKRTPICRFYRNGNCKHGLKGRECNYSHPKMCRKFTQHGTNKQRGCTQGKKCKDFHPKMCFDSIQKGECYSESCRFAHVKGTKRKPPVIKNNVTHNNKNNLLPGNNKTLPEPDHFLEVIRLLKEEILDTLNKKINAVQNQMQNLQQTHQTQPPQTLPSQPPIQTLQMTRPHILFPQQTNFNPMMQTTYQ